ncbi:MAG: hypothetical protein HYY63_05240, partial [Elusimicrobia bacterium]|nr:hypothetical protein [Elusimicrobiota bacterium]
MIPYGNKKRILRIKQGFCLTLAGIFLFSSLAPAYAQAKNHERSHNSYHLRNRVQSMVEASPAEKATFLKRVSAVTGQKMAEPFSLPNSLQREYQTTHHFFIRTASQIKKFASRFKENWNGSHFSIKRLETWLSKNLWWEDAALTGIGALAIITSAQDLLFFSLGICILLFTLLHIPNLEPDWEHTKSKALLNQKTVPNKVIWMTGYILNLVLGAAMLQVALLAPIIAWREGASPALIGILAGAALSAHLIHALYSQKVQNHPSLQIGRIILGIAPLTIFRKEDAGRQESEPKRKFRLAQVVTVIANSKGKVKRDESDYRRLNLEKFLALPENQYPKESEKRLETYLHHQAAFPGQSLIELIANAQDASVLNKKIGRFGVGGYQSLGELSHPEDRVILESSKDGVEGVRFTFWVEKKEVWFDYEILENGEIEKGTYVQVRKKLSPSIVVAYKKMMERKLRVNTRSAIQRSDGSPVNHPENYLYLNGEESGTVDTSVPPVFADVNENGYFAKDSGVGMGLKEVLERFLLPNRTDKHLTGEEETKCFYTREISRESDTELWLSGVEIESHWVRGKVNLLREALFELPHDSDISEERGVFNL